MSDSIVISGALKKRDAKRLTNAIRGSTVGPTTLYYAGVTAPIIGAGMALLTSAALEAIGTSAYWTVMLSAILAAVSGIVWYLIFMRWAYRHQHGRGAEMEQVTEIKLTDDDLIIRRGLVTTLIDWDAIDEIKSTRSYTIVYFDGADPLMVPHDWFGEKTACEIFIRRLGQGIKGE
ncbi:MAG: YcxB family protein [Pseudomonadota bacterium]